jgi:ABC-type dipeptide/oligopeptide/nickel transport system permease component
MPAFWFALLLVQLFSVKLGWLPAAGIGTWKHWILRDRFACPCLYGIYCPSMRSNMLEVIRQDYIVTARAKDYLNIRYFIGMP